MPFFAVDSPPAAAGKRAVNVATSGPLGYDVTFGEMDPDHKREISHRAESFRQLMAACFTGR